MFRHGGPLVGYDNGGDLMARINKYMDLKNAIGHLGGRDVTLPKGGQALDDALWQIHQEINKKGGVNQIRSSSPQLYEQIRKSGMDVSDLKAKSIPAQRGLFGKILSKGLGGHGLGALLAFALMPDRAGAGQDEKLERMRADAAYQKMMDKQHGEGWSSDPVETPRINLPVDPSRFIR